MIQAVVDTGLGGYGCLAEQCVDQLDMAFEFAEPYELANGKVIVQDVFRKASCLMGGS
jgi:predicted aspartyl protease